MAHGLYFEAQLLVANIETKWKSRSRGTLGPGRGPLGRGRLLD